MIACTQLKNILQTIKKYFNLKDNRRYLYLAIPFIKKRFLVTPSSMKFPNFKNFIFQETIPKFQETQMAYGVRCTDTLHHLEIVNIG